MVFALWIVLGFGVGIFIASYAITRMVLAERRASRLGEDDHAAHEAPRQAA